MKETSAIQPEAVQPVKKEWVKPEMEEIKLNNGQIKINFESTFYRT